MNNQFVWQLKCEKRAFQIGFDLATEHGIYLTRNHPKFDAAVELIKKHLEMGILGNGPIENLVILLVKGSKNENPTET